MIEDDIRTALLPVFPGVEVVLAYENGPRPPGLYVTVRIENAHKLPAHVGPLPTADIPIPQFADRAIQAHRTGQVEIQCFGDQGYDVLDAAINLLSSEAAVDAAGALDIAFGRASDIQRVPVLRNDSTYENRAIVSLPVTYTRGGVESLSWIETVNALAKVGDLPEMPIHATIVDN